MAKPTVKTTNNKPDPQKAVAFVSPNALSADVGQKAMEAFKTTKATDEQISELNAENTDRKRQTLKWLTLAFVKAATADKGIHLADWQSDKASDVSALKQKLEVAVGIRTATRQADGTDEIKLAAWTKDYLPQPKETKENSDDWQRKENFRTNFQPVFKKAMGAAHAVMLKGIEMIDHKETGALMITGKAVKERFGVDSVLLNEKREYKEGDRKIELKKTPSYTELQRISAESAGKTVQTRVQSQAKLQGPLTEKDILAAVQSLQAAIPKLKGFSDELASALEALADTIETAVSDNEGVQAA